MRDRLLGGVRLIPWLIEAVLAQGDEARAGSLLTRHRELLARVEEPTPRDLALRFDLADVLWDHGWGEAAIELIEQLGPYYERTEAAEPDPATAWLAEHPRSALDHPEETTPRPPVEGRRAPSSDR